MSLTPWMDGPFNGLWKGLNDQNNERCFKFELNAADCMEAYGKHHAYRKCIDYMDDLRECVYRLKQNMRISIMRQERQRQWRAGERKTYYEPGPVEDSY